MQQENVVFYEALIPLPLIIVVKIITSGFPPTQCLETHETQMLQPTLF